MPPEPYRWDRKRERSSESLGSYVSRWRDTPPHHRWGSPDFRRPSGHGRQGGWHLPSEASGHGFAPTRSIDKILDDESCRPEGKYFRNSRENKGSFRQNYWKGQSWETATLPNGPGRSADVNGQRSVNDKRMFNSHSHSDFVNNWDKFHVKDKYNENDGVSGLGTGERFLRENSLGSIDLKSFKWTRSGSLSSRGSGFSHSSSSKSIGVDISNTKVDVTQAVASPSGDATACVTSAAPKEDASSRKKPRLRWGEGLAKFEKKKVEVPDDDGTKNGMSVCGSDAGPLLSHALNVANKSPRVRSFSDCASPATPSSVACSSSPGTDEKSFVKSANVDTGTSNLSASSYPLSNHSEDLAFDLENLDLISVPNLSSSLNKLLQSDDSSSLDSAFAKSTAMKKLLIWKADISKALEVTESEIDSLENELKSLIYHCGSDCPCPCPAASSSLPVVCNEKPYDEPCARPFDLISSGDMVREKTLCSHEEENVVKDEGIDSPGTSTSKSVEPLPLGKADSPSDIACGDGVQLITSNSVASLSTEGVRCDRDIILYDLIITSNKDTASRASEVFSKLLPSDQCIIDISRAASSPCPAKDPLIKEKFVKRKRFLRFKERVIALKYRAFQHLWKEDMRLLSMRRYCAKSQKRFELSSRTVHSGHQKHRSSSRSRFSSPGNLSLVPTTEMVDFTSKLLSDSQVQIYRSTLKMPAIVLDNKDKMVSRFISSNGLVEDSCAVEKEKSMINPWMSDEREIFMDKLATCGKDFRKIASFLDHKTTADCVEFYYKNHKLDCFQKTKNKQDCEKKGKSHSTNTYLVTSGKRWNREINAASLDMLGAATAVAAANVDDVILEMPGSLDDERETVAADVLAGICGSLSSEAMSSCITSSVDPGEGYQELKCHRVGSSTGRPLTPEVTQNVDDETCSDESYVEMTDPSDWTDQEKSIFVQAVALYGKDFTMISRRIGTKSSNQCKVFFSKARKCLGLDMMHRGPANEGMLTSDDANGNGSDTEDACLVETELGSKIDEELYLTHLKGNHNVYPADLNRSEDCKEMELKPGKLVSYDYDLKAELDFGGDTNIENGSETPVLQAHENAYIPSDTEAGLNEDTGHATMEKSVSTKDANDPGGKAEGEAAGEVTGEYSGAVILGHELVIPESSSMHDVGAENSDANIAATSGLNCLTRYSNSARQSVGNAFLLAPESFHMSPSFDFDDLSHKQCQQTASTDDHHQPLTSSDRIESSQILRGYPASTTNGMNVDISCERPTLFQSISELDRNSHSDRYSSQNGFLQKCNSSKHHGSVAELQFLPHEQMRVDPRPQQLSSSDEARPCRNGNVKLFGQILTNPVSQHKSCSSKHENEDKVRQHSKLSGESSFNMKLKVDGKSAVSKIDLNNNSGLEDVPVRSSYGYWDGNRIQTGFPSIPDSAILLAKYPAAFSNYPMPSSNIRQQHPIPSVVNCNGENSNGVSARQTRTRDVAKVQPFTVDMKQCQDILFSQMKRRSEINVVGRGGGISDPVAAIKMHYAKTEQYREEESWRDKGNIGM